MTLSDYIETIASSIRTALPVFSLVEEYSEQKKRFITPAVFLEVSSLDREDDPGTGEVAMSVRVDCYVVVSFKTHKAKAVVRDLSSDLAVHLHGNRFGMPVAPSQLIGCYPDGFGDDQEQFETWRVEFDQVVHLGQNVWDEEGILPVEVYLGIAPEVGVEHVDKYFLADPEFVPNG